MWFCARTRNVRPSILLGKGMYVPVPVLYVLYYCISCMEDRTCPRNSHEIPFVPIPPQVSEPPDLFSSVGGPAAKSNLGDKYRTDYIRLVRNKTLQVCLHLGNIIVAGLLRMHRLRLPLYSRHRPISVSARGRLVALGGPLVASSLENGGAIMAVLYCFSMCGAWTEPPPRRLYSRIGRRGKKI